MKIIIISALWCPSCLVMKKIYKNLEQKYQNINFSYLDYDFDNDIIEKYQIGNVLPVFIILKNDIEIKRIIGEHKEEEYETYIKEIYENN